MPSKSTIRIMGALTVSAFAGQILGTIIRREHPKASVVPRMCDQLFERSVQVRKRWPLMDPRGVWETEQRIKYLERHILGNGVTSDVLLWLARLMLMDCTSGLWDAGSVRTGAIDGILRLVEDIHSKMDGGSGREEAEVIMGQWVESLEKPVRRVA